MKCSNCGTNFAYTQYSTDEIDAVFCSDRCLGHALEKLSKKSCGNCETCSCKKRETRSCFICTEPAATTRSVGEVCVTCANALDMNDARTLIVRGETHD